MRTTTLAAACLLMIGCATTEQPSANADSPAAPTATPAPAEAAPVTTSAAQAPAADPPAADLPPPPASIAYPFKGIDLIAPDCKESTAVVTTAPPKVGWEYDWIWTRQALYANPQFKIVDWPSKPSKPMEVRMDVYKIDNGFALVGACGNGSTCNKLAAMYKRTVPSCKPQLHCGKIPLAGEPRRSNIIPKDGEWLPEDLTGKCARIGTCMFMLKTFVSGNPGLDCQSKPTSFNLACAMKDDCTKVVACLDQK